MDKISVIETEYVSTEPNCPWGDWYRNWNSEFCWKLSSKANMKHCWLLVASRSYQNAIGITEAQQICVGGLLQVKTFQPDIKGRTQALTFGGKRLWKTKKNGVLWRLRSLKTLRQQKRSKTEKVTNFFHVKGFSSIIDRKNQGFNTGQKSVWESAQDQPAEKYNATILKKKQI